MLSVLTLDATTVEVHDPDNGGFDVVQRVREDAKRHKERRSKQVWHTADEAAAAWKAGNVLWDEWELVAK